MGKKDDKAAVEVETEVKEDTIETEVGVFIEAGEETEKEVAKAEEAMEKKVLKQLK